MKNDKSHGVNKDFSISKILKKKGFYRDDFEFFLAQISFEDLIALKMEISAKELRGFMYGFPISFSVNNIVNDSILKFALSATSSKKQAAAFLGLDYDALKVKLRKFKTEEFFNEDS
jgi:hypothetical protein